jgi:tetratricopeptide (TPR) repeat protein
MNSPRLLTFGSLLALGAAVLVGCAGGESRGPAVGFASPAKMLRAAAAAYLQGKAEDAMADAARRGDNRGIVEANANFMAAAHATEDPTSIAEAIIQQADGMGRPDSGSSDPADLREAADVSYRSALRIQPRLAETSNNPNALNSLGYHLADQGKSQEDFQEAEKLLRRALHLVDTALRDMPKNSAERSFAAVNRAIGPLDSLAWSLYKQGRFEEARLLEEEAVRTPITDESQRSLRSDLLFHLGEIYRALKQYRKASSEYAAALNSDPSDELKAKITASKQLIPDGYAPPDPPPQVNA